MFFSFITKNLKWKMLTKNLVTFKKWAGLRNKNFNIMGVHWKIQFLVGWFTKNQYVKGGLPKKGRLEQFSDLKGGRGGVKRGEVFLKGEYSIAHFVLVLISSTWEGWKTKSTLEPPSGLNPGTPGLGI